MSRLGIVAIGRNEGERLRRCLRSLSAAGARVVYVDSGSTDGSVELARASGALVVELDRATGFTAAKARNAGFEALLRGHPDLDYVQFVDGDCELDAGWLPAAVSALDGDPAIAVACGRRRELFPERSLYNELCDIEWDTPAGDVLACGGDALVRVSAFRAVQGFSPGLIAGEEPELCVRLRRLGFRIRRLPAEMTRHDAAMASFGQWWKRCVRAGFAFAQGAALHGASPERHWVGELRSIWLWGAALPAAALALAAAAWPWGALLLAAYPALAVRIWLRHRRRLGGRRAALFAVACVVAKVPQFAGAVRFGRAAGSTAGPAVGGGGLIEYKSSPGRAVRPSSNP